MRLAAAIGAVGCGLTLGACVAEPAPPPRAPTLPQRIVSLDYCADQFVLKLADRSQIAAVSIDAEKEFSFMRAAAKGVPKARSSVEDVLAKKPDLVVRAYGGGPNAAGALNRAGVPVVQMGYADDFDGVRATIKEMAIAVGHPARGEALIAEMDARLATAAAAGKTTASALYVTPSGVTTGPGSLVHVMIEAAGLENFDTQPGWRPVPLEQLASAQPDVIVAAFFGHAQVQQDAWSPARHPILARAMEARPTAQLEGAWTACGGWFLVEAVESLAMARDDAERAP